MKFLKREALYETSEDKMDLITNQCNQIKALLSDENSWRFSRNLSIEKESVEAHFKGLGIPENSPLIPFFLVLGNATINLTDSYYFHFQISEDYRHEKEHFENVLGCPVEVFGTQEGAFIALKLDGSNEVWAESCFGGTPVSFGTFSDFLNYLLDDAKAAINEDDTFNSLQYEAYLRAYPEKRE